METIHGVFPTIGKIAAAALWLLAASAQAQTELLTQGFNGATLPSGWTTNGWAAGAGSGTDPFITFTNASTRTNVTAYEGTHFVRFNSWDCRSNAQLRLVSPVINASAYAHLSVGFAWHHDTRTDGRDGEGMTLQWTTNNWSATNSVLPFTMRRGAHTGWVERVLALPSQALSTNLRVGFLFNSAYGNNCYLDDVRVYGMDAVADFPYSETFESGFGVWACGPGANFAWARRGTAPLTANTGPSAAQGGSVYLHTEAGDPNYPSKTNMLEAAFNASSLQEPRLWFYYHLYGADTGALYVDVSTNGGSTWAVAWSKSGQVQTNSAGAWAYQSVNLANYGGQSSLRIRFRGVTGAGELGDMAVDTVSLTESVTIRSQSFDGADASPWSYSVTPSGQGELSTSKKNSGTYSLRLAGSSDGTSDVYVEFANTSLAGYTNVSLLVPFAATGADSGDDLYVQISYDNGSTWHGGTYANQIADGYLNLNFDFAQVVPERTLGNGNPWVAQVPGDKTQVLARVRFYDASSNNTNDFYFVDDVKLVGTPLAVDPCLDLASSVCASNSAPAAGEHVTAGAAYTKTWVMSNHSSSVWSSNSLYSFTFGRGDNPSSSSVLHFASAETVAPGGTKSFSVTFTAPTNAGTSAGFWSLRRNGTNIGERVWWNVEVDAPDIEITNAVTIVSSATASTGLGGTRHASVVGTMRWTNALTGGAGTFAAASPWSVSGISLSTGDNPITVRGTNAYGVAGEASLTITRAAAPSVVITTPDGEVASAVSALAITGTAGSAVAGYLSWTNSLGGYGSVPAETSWTIPDIPLTIGTNLLTVRGTNAAGEAASDSVSIVRQAPGGGSATLVDEPFDAAPVAPSGWSFSGITTNYTSAGSYGRAAPSVKFDDHNDRATSKTFSGGSNLTFFIKAYPASGTNSVGTFVIEQNIGGSWTMLAAVTNPVNVGATQSYAMASSVTQLRFTWNKTSGNIAFDDVIVTGVMIDPAEDTDGDGLPDWWEQFYFDGPTSAIASGDADEDGFSNYCEFIAGTDPWDESSQLRLHSPSNAAGGVFYFTWPSATNRVYTVRIATNLLNSFTDWSNNISATPPANVFRDAVHTNEQRLFYNVNVDYPGAP